VVTVTPDRVLVRPVEPPPGWQFAHGYAAGAEGDPVTRVARTGDPGTLALARLAAGGRRALLVPGSQGVVPAVAPAGGPGGSVVFAVRLPSGGAGVRLMAWRPGAAATPLRGVPPLPGTTEIVCVCR
jgi:hypothetical protein